MRYRRRRRCGRNIFFFAAFAAAAFVIVILGFASERAIRPVAKLQAQHFAEKYAATVMEKAADDYLNENELTYSDFAAVLYNGGKAVSIETLPYNIKPVRLSLPAYRSYSRSD